MEGVVLSSQFNSHVESELNREGEIKTFEYNGNIHYRLWSYYKVIYLLSNPQTGDNWRNDNLCFPIPIEQAKMLIEILDMGFHCTLDWVSDRDKYQIDIKGDSLCFKFVNDSRTKDGRMIIDYHRNDVLTFNNEQRKDFILHINNLLKLYKNYTEK